MLEKCWCALSPSRDHLVLRSGPDGIIFSLSIRWLWSNEILLGCRLNALALCPPPSVMKSPTAGERGEFRLNFNSENRHWFWIYSPPVKSWTKPRTWAAHRRILQSEIRWSGFFCLFVLFFCASLLHRAGIQKGPETSHKLSEHVKLQNNTASQWASRAPPVKL